MLRETSRDLPLDVARLTGEAVVGLASMAVHLLDPEDP